MTDENQEVLTTVQQVLRMFMLALAAGSRANLADIGTVLEAAAADPASDISDKAREMLADLAGGALALSQAGRRKQ